MQKQKMLGGHGGINETRGRTSPLIQFVRATGDDESSPTRIGATAKLASGTDSGSIVRWSMISFAKHVAMDSSCLTVSIAVLIVRCMMRVQDFVVALLGMFLTRRQCMSLIRQCTTGRGFLTALFTLIVVSLGLVGYPVVLLSVCIVDLICQSRPAVQFEKRRKSISDWFMEGVRVDADDEIDPRDALLYILCNDESIPTTLPRSPDQYDLTDGDEETVVPVKHQILVNYERDWCQVIRE